MGLFALFAGGSGAGGLKAAQGAKAAQAAQAAQSVRAAQAAKAANAARGLSAARGVQGSRGLAGLMGTNFRVPQGAVNAGTGRGLMTPTPRVSTPFQVNQAGQGAGDFWEKFQSSMGNVGDAAGQFLGAQAGRYGPLFSPSRSTGQWQPNMNPGLAGLMQQLSASYRGGYR